jgi:hypothetical protein
LCSAAAGVGFFGNEEIKKKPADPMKSLNKFVELTVELQQQVSSAKMYVIN